MVEPKLSRDEDIEERTTAFGMFNMAETYWRSAATLEAAKVKCTHPHSSVSFLYYHAIEIYLKSFLRLHGHTVKELSSRRYGHKTCCLTERAGELGLELHDEDLEIFSLMTTTDAVIRSRYLQTGAFRWPAPDGLDRVCRSIRQPIGQALRTAGFPVRNIAL